MKMKKTAHTIRNSAVSLFTLLAFSLPLIASADGNSSHTVDESLLNVESKYDTEYDAEVMYDRLQDKSRDICGSADLRMTGDLKRSKNNEDGFEGTLTAAVQRLDDPAVTKLHSH